MTDDRSEYVAGMRALADLLDANPDLPLPSTEIVWPLFRSANPRVTMAAVVRAVGGKMPKTYDDEYARVYGTLRGLRLRIWTLRADVCERVVVGTREVTEEVVAPDAPKVTVTRTVEDVEWVCSPLLAGVSS